MGGQLALTPRRLGEPQGRCGLYAEVKIVDFTGLELRHLGRPVRSQSLYRFQVSLT
jgi:hypothetical protein